MAQKQKSTTKDKEILPLKPEYIFLVLGFIFGLLLVFKNPPWQTNDEDRHFIHAYYISQGYLLPKQGDNKIGGPMPVKLKETIKSFQGIKFSDGVKISKRRLDELAEEPLNENNKKFYHNHHYNQNPVGFFPSALGIFIGQIFNDNALWLNWFARIGSLIFYLAIVFFAIKTTPIFKTTLMLFALTPMTLYQGASITYDVLLISISFLIFALALKYALDENAFFTWKDFALFLALFVVMRFAKTGYPFIPFIFLIIPLRKYKLRIPPALGTAIMAVALFVVYSNLVTWTWSSIKSAQNYKLEKTQGLKKDFKHSRTLNIEYHLSKPFEMTGDLYNNISHFKQEWTTGVIGRFGYSYTTLPGWFYFIFGTVLLTVAFFDSNKKYKLNIYQKIISFLVAAGTVSSIIVGMYLSSPVGNKMVFGLQGRYFIPAIPFLLLILYNDKFESKEWKKWKPLAVGIFACISLIYTLAYLDNIFYQP